MSVPSPARTPEALHALIEDAFNRGDLDALTEAYEENAIQVVPPEGRTVQGRDEIRIAIASLFEMQPQMKMMVDKKLETDGLALTHGRWKLVVTDAGNRSQLSGRGTMVSRRRPDGTWRVVLDDPLSAG